MPDSSRVTETTSTNGSPPTTACARLDREERAEARDRVRDRVVGVPGTRRVPAAAVEREPRDDVAEAAGVHDAVGRLEQDRERGLVHELGALEERGERIVLDGQLLAAEEEERDVGARARALREVAHELERDRDAALHVARAEPVHRAVLDPAREVLLRRDRVVVPGEDDERHLRRAAPSAKRKTSSPAYSHVRASGHEREQVLADRVLVAALRGDVHELERACGEALGERGHRASLQRP